jgi:hypothetical protein
MMAIEKKLKKLKILLKLKNVKWSKVPKPDLSKIKNEKLKVL